MSRFAPPPPSPPLLILLPLYGMRFLRSGIGSHRQHGRRFVCLFVVLGGGVAVGKENQSLSIRIDGFWGESRQSSIREGQPGSTHVGVDACRSWQNPFGSCQLKRFLAQIQRKHFQIFVNARVVKRGAASVWQGKQPVTYCVCCMQSRSIRRSRMGSTCTLKEPSCGPKTSSSSSRIMPRMLRYSCNHFAAQENKTPPTMLTSYRFIYFLNPEMAWSVSIKSVSV